ncbi:MAG: hypothetical protein ACRDZW_05660 [Acidimicrobiales bacterium]
MLLRRPALLAAAVVLAAAACSSDGRASGGGATTTSTVDTAASTTSTTTEAQSFAIPAVIDEAYVNRVLAKLYSIEGDVIRKILATNDPKLEDLKPLRAIYNESQYEFVAKGLGRLLQQDRPLFRSPPGDQKVVVTRLVSARTDCVLAEVGVDFSAVVVSPPTTLAGGTNIVALTPKSHGDDPDMINQTPWSIADAEILRPGESAREEAPCF